MSDSKQKTMAEVKEEIIDYLTEQVEINTQSLASYETDNLLPPTIPDEVRRMREMEAIKFRDRINQLSGYISFIKRAFPSPSNKENGTTEASSKSKQKRNKSQG